ncbi:hypothetical protein [Streptomyces achromogenes]|uniref:hypothetical protein n=1 Tax=Streptomyces achromogenes TaxID=67255 RepID=UPI003694E182
MPAERESFAQLNDNGHGWTVRQGGPIALWDAIEDALIAWQEAGRPDISAVRLQITPQAHAYRIGEKPALRWEHRVA